MSEAKGFDRIIGQEVAKRILRKAVRENSPAQAYLFLGPKGAGKTTVATEFAKALNCLEVKDGDACGECAHCRAIEHGNFPDIWLWSPDGKNTKIEQMQEMRSRAVLPPIRGRWEVNIVEQGDTFNEASANCILKLVEEPPAYLVNILLYRNAAAVLPTIRSRCQVVRFLPAQADELVARLVADHGCPEERAAFLAAYSEGCPGKAIRLIGDTEFFARRNQISAATGQIVRNPWLALKLAETLRGPSGKTADDSDEESDEEKPAATTGGPKRGKREIVLESLDVVTSWYRDLLAVRIRGSEAPLVNSDKRAEIESQAGQYRNARQIASCLVAVTTARKAVVGNANPQIATEALMMQLAAVGLCW